MVPSRGTIWSALDRPLREGRFKLANLTTEKRREAKSIICAEPPPRDGKKKCQDWVLDVVISLEVAEIVETGMSSQVQGLVSKPAKDLAVALGSDWVPAK